MAVELARLHVKLLAERAQLAGDGEIETFLREIPGAPGHRAQIGTVDFAVVSRAVDFVTIVGRTSLLPNNSGSRRAPRRAGFRPHALPEAAWRPVGT